MAFDEQFIMDVAQAYPSEFMGGTELARKHTLARLAVRRANPNSHSEPKQQIIDRAAIYVTNASLGAGDNMGQSLAARFGAELESERLLNTPVEVAA